MFYQKDKVTVFLRRDTGDILRPAMMAINELKLPMLKHSRATSIQYSITLTRCFFLTFYINQRLSVKTYTFIGLVEKGSYRADLCGHKVAESVKPLDVRLKVARFLHISERGFHIGVLLGKGLDKFFRSDKRQPLQFNVCQLLWQHQRTGAHFSYIRL